MIPLKEENDPLSLDSNENCEGLMFIKKEEQGQIKQEESGLDYNKLQTVLPVKEENDPLSLDINDKCEDLILISKEEEGQIKQEESDLADETIDDSVLENIEDNIQNAKYMILDKCKDNVLDNRLHKIFNEIDSASSDGFSNDKSLVFEHDIKINNNDDLADETVDDSILENVEDNIQNAKYMALNKCKDSLICSRLHKIFNEIDSTSSDGFNNDKTSVFEHDINDRLVEYNKQNINDAKRYTCNHCEKTFKSKYNLMHHNNIHIGKKSYHCTLCQKSFYRGGDLNRHFSIHIGEKRFKCNTCDKSFNNNCNLKKHLIIHTGEKKVMCSTCLKCFNSSSNLKKHLTIHNREKKFLCNICLKSFNRCDTLKRHLSIHTGDKKFSCNFCQMSFNENYQLKGHLPVHTGQKKFMCDFCHKSFNRKD
ncbi:uncharacterized protein LOC142334127 isoform X2 [Lycorma delicatula]|uniref:uncharacterized protein LOC142334127 isoform X2 n=1 Tax=Lycorma delicatula TaxID=130591 RepID=UPI003F50D52B